MSLKRAYDRLVNILIKSDLILPHICACLKPGPRFPLAYNMGLFCVYWLRCEVVVHFVDIDGIVDHHC
jgi:hypothetical protein